MIAALDNLIFICVGFVIIWAIWQFAPVAIGCAAWASKGAWSIIRALPRGVLERPFLSFMAVLFAIAFPYFALVGFIVFAMMLGDLGETNSLETRS